MSTKLSDRIATRVEWPTVLAIAGFWALFAAVVGFGTALPAVVTVIALALLGCFYGSLQHEVIHGHPTPWARLNHAMVIAPLHLTEPFSRYRQIHLDHHAAELTDPTVDPESHYVTPDEWARAGRWKRRLLVANRTLLARMVLGPVRGALRAWHLELIAMPGSSAVRWRWAGHAVAVVSIVAVLRTAGLPIWMYLLGFVFGGAALTSLRSFVEHSAHDPEPRSAVVESNWFFGLLFLNNNLHYTHHALPGATWYRLPQLTRDLRAADLVASGAGHFRGYAEIARRYMLRPFCQPVNPLLAPAPR